MGNVQTTRTTSVDRFRDRFIDLARKSGVKDTTVRWYVRHAERYLKAVSGKRLAEHTREDVTGYLKSVGRIGGIEDWQFRQIVEAVRVLLVTANAKVVGEADWAYWRDSAQTLAPDHPTIAREVPARAGASADETPVSGVRFKEKRNPPSALDEVRRSQPLLMERLVAEIRRPKYSIRTEQTYESWVCRFILFCGGRDPSEVGANRIVAFLEDLAVCGQVSASTQIQAFRQFPGQCTEFRPAVRTMAFRALHSDNNVFR